MKREVGDECWGDLEEIAQESMLWPEFIEALCIPEGISLDWGELVPPASWGELGHSSKIYEKSEN
ncbi:hypothetical protein E2C01_078371 [Portunus trituberculatus]|uniref:Uncharacterized protein n=1 Tax=Portunus trituberculatus TaxID=210409 RepID=A0A5B7IPY9_PORTR|nr:hypothetical protein [Portunus trituberculatus]